MAGANNEFSKLKSTHYKLLDAHLEDTRADKNPELEEKVFDLLKSAEKFMSDQIPRVSYLIRKISVV